MWYGAHDRTTGGRNNRREHTVQAVLIFKNTDTVTNKTLIYIISARNSST
jgi:hypothetical protein